MTSNAIWRSQFFYFLYNPEANLILAHSFAIYSDGLYLDSLTWILHTAIFIFLHSSLELNFFWLIPHNYRTFTLLPSFLYLHPSTFILHATFSYIHLWTLILKPEFPSVVLLPSGTARIVLPSIPDSYHPTLILLTISSNLHPLTLIFLT